MALGVFRHLEPQGVMRMLESQSSDMRSISSPLNIKQKIFVWLFVVRKLRPF